MVTLKLPSHPLRNTFKKFHTSPTVLAFKSFHPPPQRFGPNEEDSQLGHVFSVLPVLIPYGKFLELLLNIRWHVIFAEKAQQFLAEVLPKNEKT